MAKKVKHSPVDYVWAASRMSLGLTFLWAFFDKLMGLGFSTCNVEGIITRGCDSAWLSGGSPTEGFLKFGTKGPFAETFQSMAGNPVVDWLFMLGLLGIGFAFVFGMGVKIGAYAGATFLMMMYLASAIWPEHHPFLDEHVIYSITLIGLSMVNDTQVWGMGRWWKQQDIVKKYPVLE